MIIDGHVHAASVSFSADTLVLALDELGVDKVVTLASTLSSRPL